MMHKFFVVSLLIGSLFTTACKKRDFSKIATEAWSPTVAVPIAKASYNLYDVLSKSDSLGLIQTEADGGLFFMFNIDQDLIAANEFITLPEFSENYQESAMDYGLFPMPSYTGQENASIQEEIDFSAGADFELYNIDFKDGKLIIDVQTDLMHDVNFDFTFPDLLENGVPATSIIDLQYSGSLPQIGSDTIYLDVSELDLTQGSLGYNQLRFNAEVTIDGTGNAIIGTESFSFGFGMDNPTFDLITGDFKNQQIFDLIDTIDIDLFDNFNGGHVRFSNPSLRFGFRNSFGVDIGVDFNEVSAYDKTTQNTSLLTGLPANFVISGSTTPGSSELSTLLLNKDNSPNITNILSPTPKLLNFDLGGSVNPGPGPNFNFVADDSQLSAEIEVTLPLEGFAKGFEIRDTLDLELDLPEFVDFIEFRFVSDNGFPFEVLAEAFFVDENYNQLVDLTEGEVEALAAAEVDADGRVIEPAKSIQDLRISSADIEALRDAKHIIIVASCKTFEAQDNTVVKLFTDYGLDLNLGMKAQATVNP